MTTSRLPAITVSCPNNHEFSTRSRGGQGIDCPACRRNGKRVKVWITVNRPRTLQAQAAAITAPGTAASSDLAARWDREPPWDGEHRLALGRPADECPECSGPVLWEPSRTLTYCQACKRGGLPAAVTDHYERQAQRSAEVAVRDAPDLAAEQGARVQLRALAQRMTDQVAEWHDDVFSLAGLTGGAQRLALDYRAELAAWLPEIRQAGSQAELAAIAAEITEVTGRAASSGAIDTIERQRQAIERQHEQAARESQWAEQERAEQEQAEHDRQQAERSAALAARSEQRAIANKPQIVLSPNMRAMGQVLVMIDQRSQNRAKYGTCDFRHRTRPVAERLYGIQTTDWQGHGTGNVALDTRQARACPKHFDDAWQWVNGITRPQQSEPCYWELKS